MSKQHVTVIMGGPSVEYEVSLDSGQKIAGHLDASKYEIDIVHITKDRRWLVGRDETEMPMHEVLARMQQQATTAFIAIHGTYGEDGTIQALLSHHQIPFTGSGIGASLLAIDKVTSQELFAAAGLTVIPTTICTANTADSVQVDDFPVIVKPSRLGSSVGVRIVHDESELQPAIHEALLLDQEAMIQPLIEGREIACGVLQKHGKNEALPPTELTPLISDFFDYKAKYQPGGTKETTPPDMDAAIIAKIQKAAIVAHEAVGCASYSRSDFIVRGSELFILEINTLPGMTATSILPQQAAAAGITFPELLDIIIANAGTTV